MNRRGSEMTIGTIIAITLGVALLVFLIFGFSRGWDNLWGTVSEISGGDANVGDVARGCEVACASNDVYAYCNQPRTLRFGGNEKDVPGNCTYFQGQPGFSVTCEIC